MNLDLRQTYLNLPELFYKKTSLNSVQNPKGLLFNYGLANSLNFLSDKAEKDNIFPNDFLPYLSGNKNFYDIQPVAQAYAGHQFGHFTMLGDGRAILLAEQKAKNGSYYDIQLKGSGRTDFSRNGDGRSALGPMLREYLISEAMHYLNVPTTHSLAVVTTGESVFRETELPGAILTRVSSSHIRVGTFEYAAAFGTVNDVKSLADYVISRYYPSSANEKNRYLKLLELVCEKQAKLIALWMKYGFIHGVMNTDNMSITGETIDYGPCAFMENFSHQRVFSSIDRRGRYAYANQPEIAQWNLTRFAETLLPLLSQQENEAIELAKNELQNFRKCFDKEWLMQMKYKFGLNQDDPGDIRLIQNFLILLEKNEIDYTNSFLYLSDDLTSFEKNIKWINSEDFLNWKTEWTNRLKKENRLASDIKNEMRRQNPFVIPRNQKVEEVLGAAYNNDLGPILTLLASLRDPFNRKQDIHLTQPSRDQESFKTFCGT